MAPRACLIVDNPLRDLDGLVLVAWHLAQMGAEAYLVPMYTQAFDVFAIRPDFVLANYVRPNNIDLLRRYSGAGIRVGVLDTEGVAGKSGDEYARMVARIGCREFVQVYCLWGFEQYDAFVRHEVAPKEALELTGCPRYDYCADPWKKALPAPDQSEPYVLVNTNFPVINPRFSRGAENEKNVMVRTGFEAGFARQFVHDARLAQKGIIEVVTQLGRRFPEQRFIVRPHPFENARAYDQLSRLDNIQVQQEGTSIEWIQGAKTLIHQNCSTAIEAVMLGREPIALEWFNTPALMVNGPSRVSVRANGMGHLDSLLSTILSDEPVNVSPETAAARREIIQAFYYANDGMAAQRVASAILNVLEHKSPTHRKLGNATSLRFEAVHAVRRLLGYTSFERLRRMLRGIEFERRRESKRFTLDQVQTVLGRLCMACNKSGTVVADYTDCRRTRDGWSASGQVIRIASG